VRTTTNTRMNERIGTRAVLTALVLLALAATALVAQRAPTSLTLEEAITLAKGNNPLYLSTQNDMAAADWSRSWTRATTRSCRSARSSRSHSVRGTTARRRSCRAIRCAEMCRMSSGNARSSG